MFALGSLRSKNVSALLVGSSVAVGILSLILFVAIEKRVKDPSCPSPSSAPATSPPPSSQMP